MGFNPVQRFLNSELGCIARELHRIEMGWNASTIDDAAANANAAGLLDEYERRKQIVSALLPVAITADAVVKVLAQKIDDVHMLLDELIAAGLDDVDDGMATALTIDLDYLTGLTARIERFATENTVQYQLANVTRL